jgi:mannose/fructose/sorbose-specific phosphotransferase system IIB component
MPVVMIRIDDRLIHGQIVEGWLKPIRANRIVVVSDDVAHDKMQQILLGMAVPATIKVTSYSVDEAARMLRGDDDPFCEDRVLLLFSRPDAVFRLLKQGVAMTSVNVGGMHYSQGKRQILRNLSVDEDDITALRELHKSGIELEGRVLPSDERVNIIEALERELKRENP